MSRLRTNSARLFAGWLLAVALFIGVSAYPLSNTLTKLMQVALLLAVYGGAIYFVWRKRAVRFLLVAVPLVVLSFSVLPGRAPDHEALSSKYLSAMQGYEGTRYVWGGENRFGIDCSGLVRRSIRDACLKHAVLTANPGLLRAWLDAWWFDASARSLGEEYRKRTVLIAEAKSVRELDHQRLLAGDLAVTGIHVLAYLGDSTWIEADPLVGKVIRLSEQERSPWFESSVKVVRWSILEAK